MVIGLGAALGAALLFGSAAVWQAVAVRRAGLVSWSMAGVALMYLLGWALHLVAISLLPLYLAQMAIGGSLAVTALVAARVVQEPLDRGDWAAMAAVLTGFLLLIAAAGPPGRDGTALPLTAALFLTWAALAVLGLLAWRWRHPRSGVLLGLLAGLSYAGAPVATRALEAPGLDLRTAFAGLTIPLFGVLGFVLQSLALERVAVTAAIAPMVLLETYVPAALGVLVFHDAVRHGLGLVALLGFLAATAGALRLTGAEGRVEQVVEASPEPVP